RDVSREEREARRTGEKAQLAEAHRERVQQAEGGPGPPSTQRLRRLRAAARRARPEARRSPVEGSGTAISSRWVTGLKEIIDGLETGEWTSAPPASSRA